MNLTTELLETTEHLLKWIIGERDCFYDGVEIDPDGKPYSMSDIQELAEYDEVINKARTVIEKVKLEIGK